LGHFGRLMDSVAETPDIPVSRLPMLLETEVRQLREWGGSLPTRVESVPLFGHGAEVVLGPKRIGESELRSGLQHVQRQILSGLERDNGGHRHPTFALAFDGSLETLLAINAAREMGASILLFHGKGRPSKIALTMRSLGIHHLFVGPESTVSASNDIPSVFRLDPTAPSGPSSLPPTHDPGEGGIIYGRAIPVGKEESAVHHGWKAIETETAGLMEFLGLCEGLGLALHFDGPPEQWAPVALATLSAGGTLFLPEPGQPPDGWELEEMVEDGDISVLVAGSQVLEQLIDTGWEAPVERVLMGDPYAPESLLKSLKDRSRVLEIGWGMPEVGGWLLVGAVKDPDDLREQRLKRTPWSPPLRVLDTAGELLPKGVAGELWVGATDEVPMGISPRMGSLSTGQMVRWVGEGRMVLDGRMDRWENLNGHYFDLAALELDLRSLGSILDAHLQIKEHNGHRRLVAHLVPAEDAQVEEADLRDRIGDLGVLPTHLHSGLPRTWDGKVDERALGILFEHANLDRSEFEPRSDEEKALAEVWKELLGIPEVGVQDKFFDLGGHSLLAVQVTLKLEEEKGLRIDPRTLFFDSLGQVAAGAMPVTAKPSPKA
jgi:acyl carrier protein